MSAQDWQASAEVLGVVMVLFNLLGGLFIYRMQASFVTRAEHAKTSERIDKSEQDITRIDVQMGKMLTNDGASDLFKRLGVVEQQGAKVVGQMEGIQDQLEAANHMLQLLVKNEIDGNRRA
jgi:hypothetical protein